MVSLFSLSLPMYKVLFFLHVFVSLEITASRTLKDFAQKILLVKISWFHNCFLQLLFREQLGRTTLYLQLNYIQHTLSILDDKAFRKHLLCLKIQSSKTAINAVCDIVLINRTKGETAPPGFHLIA